MDTSVVRGGSRRLHVRLGALLLILLLFVGVAPAAHAQSALPGSFAPGPCPIPAPEGYTLDCGTLTVAESRQPFTGRTLALAVAIVRSPSVTRQPDPVLVLAGGPGQPALPLVAAAPQVFREILATRDMVFIDQRGTGYSRPALNCTPQAAAPARLMVPLGAASNDRPALLQVGIDALLACGATYRAQGIDLAAYTSVESAADMEDLRVALGYPRWNLYGGSYGSRLGLTMLRDRPATIRSAVLESIYPLQANFHTGVFATFSEALARLNAACAADPACGAAYPDLEGAFARVVARLNAEAAVLPILNLETGEPIDYLPFTGVDLTVILFQLMYITPALPVLPAVIGEADQGNYRPLASLTSALLAERQPGDVPIVSQGMQVAVQCNEDATFAQAREFVAARDQHRAVAGLAFSPLFHEAILEICAAWGLTPTASAENQAAQSDVPTLLMSGELDPITPPANAREAARTLSRATELVIPRGGHTPSLLSPCGRATIVRFLNAPEQIPDASCLAQEPPAPFVVVP
ncbi:MAG: alpha/beta hydrolase [Chloroflexales bacterium]|nr:alpha/beta hydrolase [Chloroflexales bacterium]